MGIVPYAEVVFSFRSRKHVAHVASDAEDGVRDVCVYRIDTSAQEDARFHFCGAGVWGKKFLPVDVAGYAMDRKISAATNNALRKHGHHG